MVCKSHDTCALICGPACCEEPTACGMYDPCTFGCAKKLEVVKPMPMVLGDANRSQALPELKSLMKGNSLHPGWVYYHPSELEGGYATGDCCTGYPSIVVKADDLYPNRINFQMMGCTAFAPCVCYSPIERAVRLRAGKYKEIPHVFFHMAGHTLNEPSLCAHLCQCTGLAPSLRLIFEGDDLEKPPTRIRAMLCANELDGSCGGMGENLGCCQTTYQRTDWKASVPCTSASNHPAPPVGPIMFRDLDKSKLKVYESADGTKPPVMASQAAGSPAPVMASHPANPAPVMASHPANPAPVMASQPVQPVMAVAQPVQPVVQPVQAV